MARIALEEAEEFPVLPTDSILLVKVEESEVTTQPGKKGDWQKIEFKFKILQVLNAGDGGPVDRFDNLISNNIWGSCPFRFTTHPENKLRQWVEAILDMGDLSEGFELDTDLLNTREVRVVTTQYDKRATDPRTGKPYKAHQVGYLLPKGSSMATSRPAAAPDPWAAPPANDPWASSTAGVPAGGGGWNPGDSDEPPF